MSREIEIKQMIYVAKMAFQTNVIEIKYNCAKRYHIFTYMSFSFFNNSVNQGK